MRSLALAAALLLLAACASSPRGGGPADPNLILHDEIAAAGARDAYDLIERLRPRWLRTSARSIRLDTVILVYIDGVRFGELDSLRGLSTVSFHSVRALDAAEAGTLPGLGSRHVERAIMISTGPPR